MFSEAAAIISVIDLVPNWYIADYGKFEHDISINNHTVKFFSHRNLTPELSSLLQKIKQNLPELFNVATKLPESTAKKFIQGYFAQAWLTLRISNVNWSKYLTYLGEMDDRTYENQQITCNLVIGKGIGRGNLNDVDVQKIIDPLATSMRTYIRVNGDLKFIKYEEILWTMIKDTSAYKFHPEFLHPIHSILQDGECSVHRTNRGDIVVMNKDGLIAARRKGHWKLYDVFTFKNTLVDSIRDTLVESPMEAEPDYYRVGCNLFELLFDLSFKRHGALLVYDPHQKVIEHIANTGSIINQPLLSDKARTTLAPSVRNIRMRGVTQPPRKKLLFSEIASMDGAVIFTDEQILAFGAMIQTDSKNKSEIGARATAARSAYNWGGYPIKISSDSDITIYFKSLDDEGHSCDAKLEFL